MVEVVGQVERGEWLPPRQVNGSVPAPLDAICRKAMALRPEERYGSALALAEDVEHWLADEPVVAYPEPAGARLRRWVRKRHRRVTAAVVLLVTAVIGLTVGTVLLDRSNREARDNLEMVEGQANYFVQEVNEDLLMNEPGMQPLRQRILMKVLEDYESLLKNRPGDPHTRQQMAGANRQLGELYLQLGRMEHATGRIGAQAVDLYEGLLSGRQPRSRGLRFGLAPRPACVLADLEVQSGDPGEGKKEVDQSIRIVGGVESRGAGERRLPDRCLAAWLRPACATLAGQQGNTASGLADNKRVLEVLDDADSRMPGSDRTRARRLLRPQRMTHFTGDAFYWENVWPRLLMLGRAYTNQGILLNVSGRNGEAARVLEEAIAVHQELLQLHSRAGQFRHGMALALLHSGRVKIELGLPGKAEPALREALGLMRQLVQDDPRVKEYRATRLLAAGYLGEALFRQGRTVPATELLREAEKEAEEVLGGPRRNRSLRGQHARLLHVLGCLEGESGNLDRGLEVCLKAHEKLEQALRETPGDRSLRSDWLASREALARYRFQKGDLTRDGWISEQQGILEARKDLMGQSTPSPRFSGEAAGSAVILAGVLLEAGRPVQALACIDSVLPAHEKVVRTEEDRVKAAVKEQNEPAKIPVKAGHHASLQFFLRTRPIFSDNSLHRQWAALLAGKGAALARSGRREEAAEAVRKAVGITRGLLTGGGEMHRPSGSLVLLGSFLGKLLWELEPCYLYDLTCHLALASTLPGENGKPDPADRAVQALRCSVAAGFDNPHQLRTDPALAPLRQRDDFKKLVRDVEASRGPGAP